MGVKLLVFARRRFIQKSLVMIGFTALSAGHASMAKAAKRMSKSAANYAVHPQGKPDCDDCVHFIAPPSGKHYGQCELVTGEINPHGWCRYFQQ